MTVFEVRWLLIGAGFGEMLFVAGVFFYVRVYGRLQERRQREHGD